MSDLDYLTGFGNEHESEAEPGVLPKGRNSPQQVAGGLYAEQISGTAFTASRADTRRSWFYRRRPSVRHVTGLGEIDTGELRTAPHGERAAPVAQLRWSPIPIPDPAGTNGNHTDRGPTWLSGLRTVAANGNAHLQRGGATHLYHATRSMGGRAADHDADIGPGPDGEGRDTVFVNADGELMILPEIGRLRLVTEMGLLDVGPAELAVIPRGVKFRVDLLDGSARGYVCENYGAPFTLPEHGLIGTNALAMPRDFHYPVAAPQTDEPTRLVLKWDGRLFDTALDHTPLDVVAWHGNHAPYGYRLRDYCPVGPVLFDHPDPSIWTVLTSPSDTPGVANIDFVLFRERWLVSEDTFRPPWFHTNTMSELMGLIEGAYDGKTEGFAPGGVSIHNAFLPHGPDNGVFEAASAADLGPVRMDPFLAFMFESRYPWLPTDWAVGLPQLQAGYAEHWAGLDRLDQPRA